MRACTRVKRAVLRASLRRACFPSHALQGDSVHSLKSKRSRERLYGAGFYHYRADAVSVRASPSLALHLPTTQSICPTPLPLHLPPTPPRLLHTARSTRRCFRRDARLPRLLLLLLPLSSFLPPHNLPARCPPTFRVQGGGEGEGGRRGKGREGFSLCTVVCMLSPTSLSSSAAFVRCLLPFLSGVVISSVP